MPWEGVPAGLLGFFGSGVRGCIVVGLLTGSSFFIGSLVGLEVSGVEIGR